jgi:hypothetical protein
VDVYIHVFLTSALDGGEWSASRLDRGNWIRGWVGPRTGLDGAEKRKFENTVKKVSACEEESQSSIPVRRVLFLVRLQHQFHNSVS